MQTPPFGKPLKELLEIRQLPSNSIWLYVGSKSWEKGKLSSYCRPTRTLILPPNELPFGYLWPVKGCDILMIETSPLADLFIEDIAGVLFRDGATKVTFISINLFLTVFKKEF